MANKVEDLVNVILDSYNECDITARIDEENMLNKDILIEIIDEIRKVLFPGFLVLSAHHLEGPSFAR